MTETREFKGGTVIFREGDWELVMYSVKSGKVGIYANYGKENCQLLTELEPGKMFGEMGLIEARPRSATAVALEDTEIEVIGSDGIEDFFKNDPQKIISILQNMTNRVRQLSAEYVDACETISSYVQLEKDKKPSFWSKIEKLLTGGEEYAELYNEAYKSGIDPYMGSFSHDYYGWY